MSLRESIRPAARRLLNPSRDLPCVLLASAEATALPGAAGQERVMSYLYKWAKWPRIRAPIRPVPPERNLTLWSTPDV
jgi:hypothetical protein